MRGNLSTERKDKIYLKRERLKVSREIKIKVSKERKAEDIKRKKA